MNNPSRIRLISLLACLVSPALLTAQSFVSATSEAQISFSHINNPPQQRESTFVAGGGAIGDYDLDGYPDFYLIGGTQNHNALYRNNGDGTFSDVAQAAGVDLFDILGTGPLFADVDGDMDLDLLVFSIQQWAQAVGSDPDLLENRPRLFINQGDGSFTDASLTSGFTSGMPSYSGSMGDFDLDGDLDLFMTHWNSDDTTSKQLFWANNGSGQFTDVTIDYLGLPQNVNLDKFLFTPHITDINEDGWPDVLVASDFGTTRIFYHQGFPSGTPSFLVSQPAFITDENGMGSAVADYDNDGDLDWFVTSIWDPDGIPEGNWGVTGNRLYENTGNGQFIDATDAAGVREGYWGWGACLADFDNDGHLDIYHENGFNNQSLAGDFHFDPARFFVANGDKTFTESSAAAGLDFTGQGRGISCVDYDLDGDLDILIIPNNEAYQLYKNTTQNNHHYLQVNVFDSGANPFALGTQLSLSTPGLSQLREVSSANNYVSNNPLQQHFGLATNTQINSLEISWPDGQTQTITSQLAVDTNISVGRYCHTVYLSHFTDPQNNQLEVHLHQNDGNPLAGTAVQLSVFQGPGSGTVLNEVTDANGTAAFLLNFAANGTDRILYTFTAGGEPQRCVALARWQVDLIFADDFE